MAPLDTVSQTFEPSSTSIVWTRPGTFAPIIAWCRERCANFRVPRHLRIVDGVERIGMTGSAKIQKNRLRDFALRDLGLG